MLQHVLNGQAKCMQHFHHFQNNMWMFMCPKPLARNKWTSCACSSPTMLCEHDQTSATSSNIQMLHKKNLIQHIATGQPNICNMLSQTNNFARYCTEMLQGFAQALTFLMTYSKFSWAKHSSSETKHQPWTGLPLNLTKIMSRPNNSRSQGFTHADKAIQTMFTPKGQLTPKQQNVEGGFNLIWHVTIISKLQMNDCLVTLHTNTSTSLSWLENYKQSLISLKA